jgi:hypothetical protein
MARPFAYVRLHSWIGDLRKCNAAITVEQMVTPSKNFLKKQSGVKLMSNKIQ